MLTYTYHLLVGSNLGDREGQLALARQRIESQLGSIQLASHIYETQPWGYEDQPWFLNQALEVESTLPPDEALTTLKQIEVLAGRLPGEKWHARHLDIDILFCGDRVVDIPRLRIPHPELHNRQFVLVPLVEIAAAFVHPVLQKSVEELYQDCRDPGEVFIFSPEDDGESL